MKHRPIRKLLLLIALFLCGRVLTNGEMQRCFFRTDGTDFYREGYDRKPLMPEYGIDAAGE